MMHMNLLRTRMLFWLLAMSTAVTTPVAAQETADVKQELAALRAELQQLRAEVAALKGARETAQPAAVDPVAQLPAAVELLQTQVAELAQTKVESTSRFPVKLFGTIHAHAFSNSGTPNWLDIPNLVNPPPADGHTGTFSISLRQTRIGFTADGPMLGSVRTSGVVAMDFFGGIPGFQTGQVMGLPRLLVAFARLDGEKTAAEIGQDQVMLAPKDPTSLAGFAFPLLFRSGNLYLRAPQVRVERTIAGPLRIAGGIVAPIGGDLVGEDYRFVPPALAGERSRRPGVQGRLAWTTTDDANAPRVVDVGLSGHYAWERRPLQLADSWAGALDFTLRRGWIGVAGEVFTGENIDAFGGALGLDARADGGWAELQVRPTSRVSMQAGAGVDDIRNAALNLPRRRNLSAYGNVIVSITPEVETSFEYRWLETTPPGVAERRNNHFDWVFAYKF
jgi:cell division protein FtsB